MRRLLSILLLLPLFAAAQTPSSNNFQINAPKAIDSRTHKLSSTIPISSIPYASVSEANALIPVDRRYIGLTVCIGTTTNCTEYWYSGGTSNANLVLKFTAVDTTILLSKALAAATYLRIDAAPSGGGSGDSLTKALRANTQNSEYHMARVTSISDSFASFNFTVGPNEYDIKEYDDSTAILVYDGQNFSSLIRVRFNKLTGRPFFTPRSPQQTIDGIWNTPQGDSIIAWKGNPYIKADGSEAKDEDQAHYCTLYINRRTKMIYVFASNFSAGTRLYRGKNFNEIQNDTGRIIGRFNDFHVSEELDGTLLAVSHHFDFPSRSEDLMISRADNPEGPWKIVGFLPINSSETGATPGFDQAADPEIHTAGREKFLMRTSNRLGKNNLPRLRSSISIQEWEITPENVLRLKGKLMHVNTPYVSNPVYFKRKSTGDEFLVYSKANAIYSTNSISNPDIEKAFAQTGRLVFAKLTDKTALDFPRDFNNQIQIVPGAGKEIVSNFPYTKFGAGVITDSAKGLSATSGNATLWGFVNYKYAQSKIATFDITPTQIPTSGQLAYICRIVADSPTVNKSAISFYLNSSSQFVVRYSYNDGSSQTASVPVQVGVRSLVTFEDVTGRAQFLGSQFGSASPNMVDPFATDGTRPQFYTLFNTQTDSSAALGQFYGTIHGLAITREKPRRYVTFNDNGNISLKYRNVLVDAPNAGSPLVLNLPIDEGFGEAFTYRNPDDLYYIQLVSGPGVMLPQVESYPGSGSPYMLTQRGQSVQLSYTPVQGYRVVASAANTSGFTGTSRAGTVYVSGVAQSDNGSAQFVTLARAYQIADSLAKLRAAEAIEAYAESIIDTNVYDPAARIFIDTIKNGGEKLTLLERSAINYYVKALKDSALWPIIKADWPMVGRGANAHAYNLKNPALYKLSYETAYTHDSTGIKPTGYGSINTGYIVPNEGHNTSMLFGMSLYSRTQEVSSEYDMYNGLDVINSESMILSLNNTASYFSAFNDFKSAANTISVGAFSGAVNGGIYTMYRGLTQIFSAAGSPTVTAKTSPIRIAGFKAFSHAGIDNGFTPAQQLTFNRIQQQYQTRLNRQIP